MTDSTSTLSEVPTLLEERRRYESWLVALEARRGSTPQHVFERVQTDYRTRLERVAERLASFRGAIAEERTNLQSRLSLLEAEEGLRRDERAELELRSHVGELTGVDADTALGAVDQALGQLVGERHGLVERIGELGTLLTDNAIQSTARAAPGKESHLSQVAPAVPVAVEQSSESVRAPGSPRAAPKPASPDAPPPPAPAAAVVGPTEPSQVPPRPRGPRPSFDEPAFSRSVVGKNDAASHAAARKEAAPSPAKLDRPLVARGSTEPLIQAPAGIVQEESVGESLLAGVENARLETGEHRLAVNTPSSTPIVLRSSTTVEQSKTLKCNECAGMNYPTEWYCERCGAELAAL